MVFKLALVGLASLFLSAAPASTPAANDLCCCGAACSCEVCLCNELGCDCDGSCCESGCCDAGAACCVD